MLMSRLPFRLALRLLLSRRRKSVRRAQESKRASVKMSTPKVCKIWAGAMMFFWRLKDDGTSSLS